MRVAVHMPKLGESVVEGTVARWLKTPGQAVVKLEPLLEISTDKIDTEIPSPGEGVLLEIIVPEGRTVQVGTVLAYIGAPEEMRRETPDESVVGASVVGISSAVQTFDSVAAAAPSSTISSEQSEQEVEKPSGRAFISPVVAKIAREYNLDLAQVPGSGLAGRITKKDALAFVEAQAKRQSAAPLPTPPAQHLETAAPRPTGAPTLPALSADEILQPLSAMRRAIAQHMVYSKQTSPHVTTVFEVDMTAVVVHRQAYKDDFAERGLNLTFTPYFVAAAAAALRSHPDVNARFTEQGIVSNRRIHIGIAVAVTRNNEAGLLTPVIRDADEKNLAGLTRAVNEVSERARSGKLTPDDLQGGVFTITNHGVSGSLIGTPIINQPQSAILGIGAIVKRPVVRSANLSLLPSAEDAILIRPMCYLSLSFDHRSLDGANADHFLTEIKRMLENWKDDE